MGRVRLANKNEKVVKCPKCSNIIHTTKKEDIQCGDCGERFSLKGHVIKL